MEIVEVGVQVLVVADSRVPRFASYHRVRASTFYLDLAVSGLRDY